MTGNTTYLPYIMFSRCRASKVGSSESTRSILKLGVVVKNTQFLRNDILDNNLEDCYLSG